MTIGELLDRAWSARALPIHYRLGSGAPPSSPTPAGEDGCCDCSGFVAWACGYNRFQPNLGFLVTLNGGWMNTDGIVEDRRQAAGLWYPVTGLACVGDVLVYPSAAYAKNKGMVAIKKPPRIGHVGLVTGVKKGGLRVLHCSASNDKSHGYAIDETDATPFERVSYTVRVRYAGLSG